MKKVINIFQSVTIIIGVLVVLLFLVPRIFGIIPFIVLSGSMEPGIKTGSVVFVDTNVKVKDIEAGDVIAFKVGKSQVTHRVVSVNSDNTFTTKGDANDTVDLNNVKFQNFKGKTISTIPYVGYALRLAQTKFGFLILSILILINLLSLFLIKDNKNEADKKNIKCKNT